MDKKTLFKEFASRHPELLTFIKNKQNTWQDFYEIYDKYEKLKAYLCGNFYIALDSYAIVLNDCFIEVK